MNKETIFKLYKQKIIDDDYTVKDLLQDESDGLFDVELDGITYKISHEESIGGANGDREYSAFIFSVTDSEGKTFWRVEGWYSSEEGLNLNWNKPHEVVAKEQTIITYQPK